MLASQRLERSITAATNPFVALLPVGTFRFALARTALVDLRGTAMAAVQETEQVSPSVDYQHQRDFGCFLGL
jgi:hypothetical protein